MTTSDDSLVCWLLSALFLLLGMVMFAFDKDIAGGFFCSFSGGIIASYYTAFYTERKLRIPPKEVFVDKGAYRSMTAKR